MPVSDRDERRDQWSDLNGEPKAQISMKLPNRFYYLP